MMRITEVITTAGFMVAAVLDQSQLNILDAFGWQGRRRGSRYSMEGKEGDIGRYGMFVCANELMMKPNKSQTKAGR